MHLIQTSGTRDAPGLRFDGESAHASPGAGGLHLTLPVPLLSGKIPSNIPATRKGKSSLGSWEEWGIPAYGLHLGIGIKPVGRPLAQVSRECYEELLRRTGDRNLYRIWNFIPGINEATDGLENYRAFCVGRSEAFHRAAANSPQSRMPAASGVGCEGSNLLVIAIYGEDEATHFENPLQVPAYRYPDDYGPRPPSFARATVVRRENPLVFVSGTAAVRGHQSVGNGDIVAQTRETVRNLSAIFAETDRQGATPACGRYRRHFTVYLRKPADRALVDPILRSGLSITDEDVLWLKADICRAELDIEVEVALYPQMGKVKS